MDTVIVIGLLWMLSLVAFLVCRVYHSSQKRIGDKIGAIGIVGCCAWVCYHLIRGVL